MRNSTDRYRSRWKSLVRWVVPKYIRRKAYRLLTFFSKWEYVGFARYCSACDRRSSKFLDFDLRPYHGDNGIIPAIIVSDTRCPWCGAHLHHRLLWTILPRIIEQATKTQTRISLLHFAPESFSTKQLKCMNNVDYITTDLMRKDVKVQLDMCQLGLRDGSIDLIVASHVLEHVVDDFAALRELHRILRPGGKAVILVPILAERSFEHPDVHSEEDRLRLYGQRDHVRAYGLDLADRITGVGFEVELVSARSFEQLRVPNYLLDVQGFAFIASKTRIASVDNEQTAAI